MSCQISKNIDQFALLVLTRLRHNITIFVLQEKKVDQVPDTALLNELWHETLTAWLKWETIKTEIEYLKQ